jgi:hypothetical protein
MSQSCYKIDRPPVHKQEIFDRVSKLYMHLRRVGSTCHCVLGCTAHSKTPPAVFGRAGMCVMAEGCNRIVSMINPKYKNGRLTGRSLSRATLPSIANEENRTLVGATQVTHWQRTGRGSGRTKAGEQLKSHTHPGSEWRCNDPMIQAENLVVPT